jgi:hypothetical protein
MVNNDIGFPNRLQTGRSLKLITYIRLVARLVTVLHGALPYRPLNAFTERFLKHNDNFCLQYLGLHKFFVQEISAVSPSPYFFQPVKQSAHSAKSTLFYGDYPLKVQ